jgi:hypothetical protein
MWLHRVTPDPFQMDKISPSNIGQFADRTSIRGNELIAKFDRFGNGARRSDFEVGVDWSDVEKLIAEFSRAKHPAAMEFESALELARALAAAGWKPPEISS